MAEVSLADVLHGCKISLGIGLIGQCERIAALGNVPLPAFFRYKQTMIFRAYQTFPPCLLDRLERETSVSLPRAPSGKLSFYIEKGGREKEKVRECAWQLSLFLPAPIHLEIVATLLRVMVLSIR